MKLSDFYPPTPENITNANRAINKYAKANEHEALESLIDIFEDAQQACKKENDLVGEDLAGFHTYGGLIISAASHAAEAKSATNFLKQH